MPNLKPIVILVKSLIPIIILYYLSVHKQELKDDL